MENLDLVGNPVTESKDYRDEMFKMLPKLVALDAIDKEGKLVGGDDHAARLTCPGASQAPDMRNRVAAMQKYPLIARLNLL